MYARVRACVNDTFTLNLEVWASLHPFSHTDFIINSVL